MNRSTVSITIEGYDGDTRWTQRFQNDCSALKPGTVLRVITDPELSQLKDDLERSKARHKKATKHIAELINANETLKSHVEAARITPTLLPKKLDEAHEALRKAGEENERVESLYKLAIGSIRRLENENHWVQQNLDSARKEVESLVGKLTREKSRNLIDPVAAAEERKAAYNVRREERVNHLEEEIAELKEAITGGLVARDVDYAATAAAHRKMITTLNHVIEDQSNEIEDMFECKRASDGGWDVTLEELWACKEEIARNNQADKDLRVENFNLKMTNKKLEERAQSYMAMADGNHNALVKAREELSFLHKQNERLHSQSQETINRLYDLFTELSPDGSLFDGVSMIQWFREWVKTLTPSGTLREGYDYIIRNTTHISGPQPEEEYSDWRQK